MGTLSLFSIICATHIQQNIGILIEEFFYNTFMVCAIFMSLGDFK